MGVARSGIIQPWTAVVVQPLELLRYRPNSTSGRWGAHLSLEPMLLYSNVFAERYEVGGYTRGYFIGADPCRPQVSGNRYGCALCSHMWCTLDAPRHKSTSESNLAEAPSYRCVPVVFFPSTLTFAPRSREELLLSCCCCCCCCCC